MRPSSIGLVGSLVLVSTGISGRLGALVQLYPVGGRLMQMVGAAASEGARRGRHGASCLWCSARRTRSDERDRRANREGQMIMTQHGRRWGCAGLFVRVGSTPDGGFELLVREATDQPWKPGVIGDRMTGRSRQLLGGRQNAPYPAVATTPTRCASCTRRVETGRGNRHRRRPPVRCRWAVHSSHQACDSGRQLLPR